MQKIVDARGMACPMPVINTKKVLEDQTVDSVTTVVDNEAAQQNVAALAASMGCDVDVQQKGSEYYIQITKKGLRVSNEDHTDGNTVIFVNSAELGHGSAELGAVLMKSLMVTLVESTTPPKTMLFVNSGVTLTCENSPVLEHLLNLKQKGVEILSCGTCLDYFKLKEKLCVGQVTNMYTIYEKMSTAGRVITL